MSFEKICFGLKGGNRVASDRSRNEVLFAPVLPFVDRLLDRTAHSAVRGPIFSRCVAYVSTDGRRHIADSISLQDRLFISRRKYSVKFTQ